MTLSDAEKKMIERLRKREAMLLRWRWPLVIVHGGVVIAAFVLLVVLVQFPDDVPNFRLTAVAFMLPPLLLLMTGSSLWLGYVIANWHGNAKTHLLLRLIDESHTNAA
jgi:hypothetical protein